ncbi:MAG TPA: methylated-DNA--[protein]-cysteine S-methyltransferase [Blastocatellia bacterium]|nr:methylated-DNA--[protein]-cysteine S-methyltransferase [Blastocatellia bacterium]
MDSRVFFTSLDSPVGALFLTSNGEAITELFMEKHTGGPKPINKWRRDDNLFREASNQLRAYFAGELTDFDLPLATNGAPFQQRVWAELRKIPYGSTVSYGELARRMGNPQAARAVGAANGSNPISIIIPCHRVIGSNGKLTGYGGGIERKKFLLEFEAETWAKMNSSGR